MAKQIPDGETFLQTGKIFNDLFEILFIIFGRLLNVIGHCEHEFVISVYEIFDVIGTVAKFWNFRFLDCVQMTFVNVIEEPHLETEDFRALHFKASHGNGTVSINCIFLKKIFFCNIVGNCNPGFEFF